MKKLRKIFPWMPVLAAATPLIAYALDPVYGVLSKVRSWVVALIPIVTSIVVIVFLWGIVKYITAAGDMEKEKDARGHIIYGLIGISVMIGIWGIMNFIFNVFDLGGVGSPVDLPSFNVP